jgi:phosphoribosylanthranilate isomerase
VTLVKICGLTLADDVARVVAAGADFLGLNFWSKSKRHVDVERAALLAEVARGTASAMGSTLKIVGVFVEPSLAEVTRAVAAANLDVLQLHGEHESPAFVRELAHEFSRPIWRAFPLGEVADLDRLEAFHTEARVEAILVDAPAATLRHATGNPKPGAPPRVIDFALVAQARTRLSEAKLVMAGGLDPTNIAAAIAAAQPWCVDVASGVESAPGIKDPAKVSAFIAAARAAAMPT